jgi:hypothetical protein
VGLLEGFDNPRRAATRQGAAEHDHRELLRAAGDDVQLLAAELAAIAAERHAG